MDAYCYGLHCMSERNNAKTLIDHLLHVVEQVVNRVSGCLRLPANYLIKCLTDPGWITETIQHSPFLDKHHQYSLFMLYVLHVATVQRWINHPVGLHICMKEFSEVGCVN